VVVDELALVRLGLATLLLALDTRAGVDVVAETPSGREAAELLRGHDGDLAVIGAPADMPVVEAVRRARAGSDTVLIVALLGAGQFDSVGAVVDAGANGVELRGAPSGSLSDAIAAVLAGGRYVAETLSSGLVGRLEPVEPRAEEGRHHDLLSSREREVLALLAGGASNREIASTLSVTVATVKSHLVHVYAKLEARNRQQALSRAVALGLLA
jgi:DNA-binding NarL/FixJ family response regulator